MGDQATNMENKHKQKQRTLAMILNKQLEFLHQECSMEKLSNNEVFSRPLVRRASYKDENKERMTW